MRRASESFTDEQARRINDAVVEAESKTSAEIVPVVATASGRYDRPEDVVGLWFALAALIGAWLLLPEARGEPGSWGGFPAAAKLVCLLAAVVVGFVAGAVAATYVGWLRRLFTPRSQMADEVAAAARQAFFDGRLHYTAGATGLLVYVSLYERMATVLADRAVLDKLGQDALDELQSRLLDQLRSAGPTEAICGVIRSAGERLGKVLPRAEDDVNELPDSLITID